MKIILTGGHLSPALGVLEALDKDTEVLFVGRKYALEGDDALSLEYKTITNLKIPFVTITTGRLQRRLTKHTFFSLLKFPVGILQSFFILKNFKPDVVLGFGGYICLPVAISAFLLGVPVVIHEQTLEAGFSNKLISLFAKKICISWEQSQKFFPKSKTVTTGNPIRKFMVHGSGFMVHKDNSLPTIYVTGGSSGSHFINTLVEGCLVKLLERFNIIHQTGDAQEFKDFDRLAKIRETLSRELHERYILKKFIDPQEIDQILNVCDLVIGRAGINTVIELIYFEKPSLLIPLPYSQNKEQLKNALFLENLGLGKVLSQEDLNSERYFSEIIQMFKNLEEYKIKSKAGNLLIKNAGKNIVEVVEYVGKKKKT